MKRQTLQVKIPFWMPWLYGVMSLWLVPWILHLQTMLPEQRFSIPWRGMWVWFDVALLAVTLVTTYFLYRKSVWASLALAALAALLLADTWFDFMTSSMAVSETMASATDLFVEMPLAVFSLGCAVYILRQVAPAKQGRSLE